MQYLSLGHYHEYRGRVYLPAVLSVNELESGFLSELERLLLGVELRVRIVFRSSRSLLRSLSSAIFFHNFSALEQSLFSQLVLYQYRLKHSHIHATMLPEVLETPLVELDVVIHDAFLQVDLGDSVLDFV